MQRYRVQGAPDQRRRRYYHRHHGGQPNRLAGEASGLIQRSDAMGVLPSPGRYSESGVEAMKMQMTVLGTAMYQEGKLACHIDTQQQIVRISILDQNDKAFGYVEYTFDEMPLASGSYKS